MKVGGGLLAGVGQALFSLMLHLFGAVLLGMALFPAGLWCAAVWSGFAGAPGWERVLALCMAGATGYFIFGFSLMLLVSLVRCLLGLRLKEGTYSMFSAGAVKWALSNALQLLVWTTFGDFILLTPFSILFYRMMGAKVGHNVQINSKFCADLSLLEIGDGSVIGGHATVIAHAFERKGLVLKRVKIGRRVVVGLNAIVLPGCEIGDRAVLAAGAVVPKYTKVPAGAIYVDRDHAVQPRRLDGGSPAGAPGQSAAAPPAG